jgi:ribosomal protein S18 acetylase RimI-like enzyme
MAITIRVLRSGDESVLSNVAAEVFDNPIDEQSTREFLADPRHHIAVTIDDGLVVGFASGVHYVHPDKGPQLWVNEVGVAPTHRGRGLAKALLHELFEVGRIRGCAVAWVLTDRTNIAAVALYKAAGGIEAADGLSNSMVGYSFKLSSPGKT